MRQRMAAETNRCSPMHAYHLCCSFTTTKVQQLLRHRNQPRGRRPLDFSSVDRVDVVACVVRPEIFRPRLAADLRVACLRHDPVIADVLPVLHEAVTGVRSHTQPRTDRQASVVDKRVVEAVEVSEGHRRAEADIDERIHVLAVRLIVPPEVCRATIRRPSVGSERNQGMKTGATQVQVKRVKECCHAADHSPDFRPLAPYAKKFW